MVLLRLTTHAGNMFGSVIGGRWSDFKLAELKAANGGKSFPEVSTVFKRNVI